eukprot:TRINITY_DN5968_c0_g1_i2.p1 TRINITY_DN5968_c0_g1~~TRINITY_DN5968_c0_g1_i2.p1  ORF type:complete len:174 (+),score=35.43 TRINITY_DN5968_c0_g1_i2:521-1042(+)
MSKKNKSKQGNKSNNIFDLYSQKNKRSYISIVDEYPITHSNKTSKKHAVDQEELLNRKASQLSRSPMSMLPMVAIMFWLVPNTPSIITIMMIGFLGLMNPINSILNISQQFSSVEGKIANNKLVMNKVVFVALNLFVFCLGLWKFSKLDLLPTKEADWIAFYSSPVALEMSSP